MNDHSELNGRQLVHWSGRDPILDLHNLANAIAKSDAGLCNNHGQLAQPDPSTGALNNVKFDAFRAIVGKHICGARIINRGTREKPHWGPEYFTFAFDHLPHPGPPRQGVPPPAAPLEPDAKVLEEIYRHELLWRLPRVV